MLIQAGVVNNRRDGITTISLLLTLILLFSFQGGVILESPLYTY